MTPRIKICGITNWHDAKAAVDAGVDEIGFVCDEYSPRLIDPDTFCAIATRLPPHITRVGVFGSSTDVQWRTINRQVLRLFHKIQYTHDSLWSDIFRENWDMSRKIRTFNITSCDDLRKITAYNGLTQSFLLNINTEQGDSYGWELAKEVHQLGKKIYLAGGLTAENVSVAAARVLPYAVDVTVGVETEVGIKDHAKMREFVRMLKG